MSLFRVAFIADGSFGYLVKHVLEVNIVHLAMIAGGAFFAYWLGRDSGFRLRSPVRSDLRP